MQTDREKVSRKWGKYALDRESGKEVPRVFALHHPLLAELYSRQYGRLASLIRQHGPYRRVLEIGCGIGSLCVNTCRNLDLWGMPYEAYHAFDISEEVIDVARRAVAREGLRGVTLFTADANTVELPANRYDLVLISQSIHHVAELEHLYNQILGTLTPNGVFICSDYFGPTRMQWTEAQLTIMNDLLAAFPDELLPNSRKEFRLEREVKRIPLKIFLDHDPSEGVRAAEALPLAREMFEIEVHKPCGGTILYELLRGRIHNFDDEDEKDNAILRLLFVFEKTLIERGWMPSDFGMFVARRKRTS
jgi:SAM-dependent methyltransferase